MFTAQMIKLVLFWIIFFFGLGLIQSADVNAQSATCPCDFSSVLDTKECWLDPFHGNPIKTEIKSSGCLLSNSYTGPPPPTPNTPLISVAIGVVQVPSSTSWSCSLLVSAINAPELECGFQGMQLEQNLTTEEIAACKTDIEQYMTALNQVEGVSVPGGPPYVCPDDSLELTPPTQVPSLSQLGLIVMGGILGVIGFLVARRRQATT